MGHKKVYCIDCLHYHKHKSKAHPEDDNKCFVEHPPEYKPASLKPSKVVKIETYYISMQNKDNNCELYVNAWKVVVYWIIVACSTVAVIINVIRLIT